MIIQDSFGQSRLRSWQQQSNQASARMPYDEEIPSELQNKWVFDQGTFQHEMYNPSIDDTEIYTSTLFIYFQRNRYGDVTPHSIGVRMQVWDLEKARVEQEARDAGLNGARYGGDGIRDYVLLLSACRTGRSNQHFTCSNAELNYKNGSWDITVNSNYPRLYYQGELEGSARGQNYHMNGYVRPFTCLNGEISVNKESLPLLMRAGGHACVFEIPVEGLTTDDGLITVSGQ